MPKVNFRVLCFLNLLFSLSVAYAEPDAANPLPQSQQPIPAENCLSGVRAGKPFKIGDKIQVTKLRFTPSQGNPRLVGTFEIEINRAIRVSQIVMTLHQGGYQIAFPKIYSSSLQSRRNVITFKATAADPNPEEGLKNFLIEVGKMVRFESSPVEQTWNSSPKLDVNRIHMYQASSSDNSRGGLLALATITVGESLELSRIAVLYQSGQLGIEFPQETIAGTLFKYWEPLEGESKSVLIAHLKRIYEEQFGKLH